MDVSIQPADKSEHRVADLDVSGDGNAGQYENRQKERDYFILLSPLVFKNSRFVTLLCYQNADRIARQDTICAFFRIAFAFRKRLRML